MDLARGQAASEDVERACPVDGARGENIEQEQLPFGKDVHGDVAIVVQHRRREPAPSLLPHRREPDRADARRARGGDEQSADERTIPELRGRYL